MCAGSVASDTSTLQSPAGSRPQGGVLVWSRLAWARGCDSRTDWRVSATGSNLSRCLQGRPGRCEGRAVRYGNTPSGEARALTQDETFILFGRSPTGWPFGVAESTRLCWAPKRFGSMLPIFATTLPVQSQDWTKGRRRRLDLSRGRGCRPIRSQSNWSYLRACPDLRIGVGLTGKIRVACHRTLH